MNTTGKKFGGRSKGAVNKTTTEIREHYQNLVSNNLEQLNDDLASLEPLHRLKMIIELSKFVVPTLKATELTTIETDNRFNPITVTIINDQEYNSISEKLEKKY